MSFIMSSCACGTIVCCLIIIAIISVIVFYQNNKDEIQDIIPGDLNELFGREDPFAGMNETYTWPNNGKGLELTILNALDEEWHSYFYTAVQQWDSGTPDSLSLQTDVRQPDFNCTPEPDYIKVCNGNYGETDWKGINLVLTDSTGSIYASTAMMNEFFLPSTISSADRQYTMCHEIGHGFGLPHTDENFYNRDQGNCMDYTLRPSKNQQPDEENFLLLAELYGQINGVDNTTTSTTSSYSLTESSVVSSKSNISPNTETQVKVSSGNGLRRRNQIYDTQNVVHGEISRRQEGESKKHIPTWVLEKSNEITSLFMDTSFGQEQENNRHEDLHQRKLIHQSQYTEVHEFDIGENYLVHVRLLLSHEQ